MSADITPNAESEFRAEFEFWVLSFPRAVVTSLKLKISLLRRLKGKKVKDFPVLN
jgi:hypothetical protein